MKLIFIFLFACLANVALGRAVSKPAEEHKEEVENSENDIEANLEYERYLKEVVDALESDPEFRKKLDNATETDVRSGKIAHELEYVNHHVRTKLDEIKRREVERLRQLFMKQYELSNDIDREHLKITEHEHLDHDNQHTFEIEDLKKLISKTSKDLEEADKKRREEFKQYELEKEFEKQAKLQEMDEDHKRKYEEELKKNQELHNKHEKVHAPGHKAQLEEVWEQQDHMDKSDFNPKLFFRAHDYDGNGYLDEIELKTFFTNDLNKVYQPGHTEDDMREREEELERMKEEVLDEVDKNKDRMISFDEFLAQTKREDFQKDPEWETVDNQPQFTHEEYLEFERRRQQQIQQMIASGQLPAHPYYDNQQQAGYQPHPNEIPPGQQMHYQNQQQLNNQQQQQQAYQHQQQQQFQQQQYQQQQHQQQQFQQQQPQQQYHPQQHPPQYPSQAQGAPNPNIQVGNIPQQIPPAVNVNSAPANGQNVPPIVPIQQGQNDQKAPIDSKQLNNPNVINADGKH